MMRRFWKTFWFPAVLLGGAAVALVVSGCNQVGVPAGCSVVTGFEVERYLGTWYEIARLENSFERGLQRVSARYEKRSDGAVSVLNRGYSASSGAWQEARGVARLVGPPSEGRLKVSFFGPFYAGYNIIALDSVGYQWVMVAGPTHKYLWIMAREKTLSPEVMARLLEQAKSQGFDVGSLVRVSHDTEGPPSASPASPGSPSPTVSP